MDDVEVLVPAVWFGLTFSSWPSFDLVVRGQQFPEMMSRSETVGLQLLLLYYLGPHQEPPLEAEIKELAACDAQWLFCHQSF